MFWCWTMELKREWLGHEVHSRTMVLDPMCSCWRPEVYWSCIAWSRSRFVAEDLSWARTGTMFRQADTTRSTLRRSILRPDTT